MVQVHEGGRKASQIHSSWYMECGNEAMTNNHGGQILHSVKICLQQYMNCILVVVPVVTSVMPFALALHPIRCNVGPLIGIVLVAPSYMVYMY